MKSSTGASACLRGHEPGAANVALQVARFDQMQDELLN
jgi:hypothetical protein